MSHGIQKDNYSDFHLGEEVDFHLYVLKQSIVREKWHRPKQLFISLKLDGGVIVSKFP